ncbi:50S ribosomal protein L16 [Nymphon striatum]|nr:50S ribosomal protein L16 [Nymphon striatum]
MQKGRMKGISGRGHLLSNGMFGLKSLETSFITARQIEAARIAATRLYEERRSALDSRYFQISLLQKAIRRIMFEVAGVPIDVAKEALRLAAQKLPVKTKFIVARDYTAQD